MNLHAFVLEQLPAVIDKFLSFQLKIRAQNLSIRLDSVQKILDGEDSYISLKSVIIAVSIKIYRRALWFQHKMGDREKEIGIHEM
jgi:hypothetical protein